MLEFAPMIAFERQKRKINCSNLLKQIEDREREKRMTRPFEWFMVLMFIEDWSSGKSENITFLKCFKMKEKAVAVSLCVDMIESLKTKL